LANNQELRRSNARVRCATPPDRFLFVVAGGGPDPFAVFVRHRGAVVFVGIQPMEDQRLYDPLGI
jgi:hypothetical protein